MRWIILSEMTRRPRSQFLLPSLSRPEQLARAQPTQGAIHRACDSRSKLGLLSYNSYDIFPNSIALTITRVF